MQVILYKLSSSTMGSSKDDSFTEAARKWAYVGYVRVHTHDVRALTVAVPISREGSSRPIRCLALNNCFIGLASLKFCIPFSFISYFDFYYFYF